MFKYNIGQANNCRKEEIYVLTYENGIKEELLCMILEFNWHAVTSGWITPQEKFSKFKSLLQGVAISIWEVSIHDGDDRDTDIGFSEAIHCLKIKKNTGGTALANEQLY